MVSPKNAGSPETTGSPKGAMLSKLIGLDVRVPEAPADLDVHARGPRIPVLGYVTPNGGIAFGGPRRTVTRFLAVLVSVCVMVCTQFRGGQPWLIAYTVGVVVVIAAAASLGSVITWRVPRRYRLVVSAGFFALSFALWPVLQWNVSIVWVFVSITVGMSMFTSAATGALTTGLAVLSLAFQYFAGERGLQLVWVPAVLASVSLMMSAFSRQAASIVQLQQTRHELAQLAVAEERGRVARDMHDILGHSLTAIAVKAELAGMLIDAGVDGGADAGSGADAAIRARAEVAAVEELARAALADVRTTVAGYRGVSAASELANARSVLTSAGVEADFPTTVEALPAEDRELAGWLVREGVTNVLRHANARRCRIVVERDVVEVCDDGRGVRSVRASGGNGLQGLRERAEGAGWRVETGESELGGFRLAIRRVQGRSADLVGRSDGRVMRSGGDATLGAGRRAGSDEGESR